MRRGFTLIELMIVIAICGIMLAVVLPQVACVANLQNPGPGTKIGQIVRVNREGLVWQTWEGQLIRGGMTSGSGALGTVPFEFTIPDALVAECQEAMAQQTEVIINYEIEAVAQRKRTGSGHGAFLVSIQAAPERERK